MCPLDIQQLPSRFATTALDTHMAHLQCAILFGREGYKHVAPPERIPRGVLNASLDYGARGSSTLTRIMQLSETNF